MALEYTRREFIGGAVAAATAVGIEAAAGAAAPGGRRVPPDSAVRFACIGVGGKGLLDSNDAARLGRVAAICDVDEVRLAEAVRRFPGARPFTDYRRMLDAMHREIDAVTVSTPDHTHAPAAAMAMRLGKHTFCQTPLARTVHECAALGAIAREAGVVTQVGSQGLASTEMRRAAAFVRDGGIGRVREVHVWTNRPVWPQGRALRAASRPQAHLHWDLWLGPCEARPYLPGLHPFGWRGWWDYGAGALGDAGCHLLALPMLALGLRDPEWVTARCSHAPSGAFPERSRIEYGFAPAAGGPAIRLVWTDGGRRPARNLFRGEPVAASGSLIVGDRGSVYAPGDFGNEAHLAGGDRIPGDPATQPVALFDEFVRAIHSGGSPRAAFGGDGGRLTRLALLGNVAVMAPGIRLRWRAAARRMEGAPGLERYLRPTYRKGYAL